MRTLLALIGAGETEDLTRSIGPFAAAIAIAYWLLRRSDSRERELAKAARLDLEVERRAHEVTRKALADALKPRTCANCGHVT